MPPCPPPADLIWCLATDTDRSASSNKNDQIAVCHPSHKYTCIINVATASAAPKTPVPKASKTPRPYVALSRQVTTRKDVQAARIRQLIRPLLDSRGQVVIIITMVLIELNGPLLALSAWFAPPHLRSLLPLASSAKRDRLSGCCAETHPPLPMPFRS